MHILHFCVECYEFKIFKDFEIVDNRSIFFSSRKQYITSVCECGDKENIDKKVFLRDK